MHLPWAGVNDAIAMLVAQQLVLGCPLSVLQASGTGTQVSKLAAGR
jgi:hypothetical protein